MENLLLNPTLSDLVGGIESVTLSDEEARRRGTQKTVLERRAPPTFDVLIEIQERDRLVIHPDVAASVDALVRGFPPSPELRYRDEKGEVKVEKVPAPVIRTTTVQGQRRLFNADEPMISNGRTTKQPLPSPEKASLVTVDINGGLKAIRLYPYGVARNRLIQAAKRLGVPVVVAHELGEAQALMTLRAYYRNRQQPVMDAETRGLPIYVLRSNTVTQIEQSLASIFNLPDDHVIDAPVNEVQEIAQATQSAIEAVMNGQRYVDLPPASAAVRRLQHELARQAELISHSYGKEPNRYVRIFRE